MTTLRDATLADTPLVLEFITELAAYEKMADEVVATAASLEAQLFPAAGLAAAHCVLAFEGETPVGFALYFFNFSTFLARRGLYLEDLFVRPDHRGAGHGKALLLHLAQRAHADGCGRMEWCVLDWNQPAIDFYQSLGATLMNEWTTCRLDQTALERIAAAE
ncbi:MAG: GNAT family N-acetyltransferase [Opitutaceae bacterium]|jgi:GNAT superfamily N-acetyltransferase|nr:GNAT family N-acetyltransferase [Opitutaceae bacterium]